MCDVPEVDLTKQPSDVTECPYSHHPSLLLPQDQMVIIEIKAVILLLNNHPL